MGGVPELAQGLAADIELERHLAALALGLHRCREHRGELDLSLTRWQVFVDPATRIVEPAEPPANASAASVTPILSADGAQSPPATESRPASPNTQEHEIFVQVGAFGDRANAERRRAALLSGGIGGAFIFADEAATPPMYRVRIGPIRGVDDYDALVLKLEALGVSDPYLVAL